MTTMTTDELPAELQILLGVPPSQRRAAAEIYWLAFQRKLTPILGSAQQAVNLLHDALNLGQAFVATDRGRLLGLIGFHHDGKALVDVQFGMLVRTFGILQASWRAALGLLLAREPQTGELLLDGIAVHADARGRGVGTRLFESIFTFATEHGYDTIRLDVVNSNPRARQLYERLGFVPTSTHAVPLMRPFGFTAVTQMRYTLRR